MQNSNTKKSPNLSHKFQSTASQELYLALLDNTSLDDLSSDSLLSIETDIPLIISSLNSHSESEFKVQMHKSNNNEEELSLVIIGPDLPFLVESMLNYLKANNFSINLITHRVISPVKNASGETISISTSQASGAVAIMYLHLEKYIDKESLAQAAKEISHIIQCLTLSFNDWKKMTAAIEAIAEDAKSLANITNSNARSETPLFLKWLTEDNFIFLGSFETNVNGEVLEPQAKSHMGICASPLYPVKNTPIDNNPDNDKFLFIRKWSTPSVIHRAAHMDWLIIKRFDLNDNYVGTTNFLGFFTSSVYYQSTRSIPLIRSKVNNVLARYKHPEHSYNHKEMVAAIEGFSRGELLQITEDELYATATSMVSLILTPRVKLFIRPELSKEFISCTTFIPQNRFSSSVHHSIEEMLCKTFQATISKQHTLINEASLVRIQITLKIQPGITPTYDIEHIEKEINTLTTPWSDDLFNNLCKRYDRVEARELSNKFEKAFDIKYTSTFFAKQAVHDIKFIEEATSSNKVKFCGYISPHSGETSTLQLKIYSPKQELPLSATLPKLENLGLYAHDMVAYEVNTKKDNASTPVFIYHFHLKPSLPISDFTPDTIVNLVTALEMVWDNIIDSDRFNNLILNSHLNWRQALIFRSYNSYLKQINFPLTAAYILNTQLNYAALTSLLSQLFELKFNPNASQDEGKITALQKLIEENLQKVDSSSEEKVMSTLYTLIKATKRTNFYQTDASGNHKDYLSFKIASNEVADIPLPKPYAEIFVYSIRFRGIHLRGGKVARGGIRWSDRSEDMRTEILGLMKAQMTKNSVIVPVGSKGGFVLKNVTMENGRDAFLKEGIECYRLFLSGLLDITDNIIDGKVVAPNMVVRHDADDPYLVVAADKGTATFSDEANAISKKYNFWLGDAFASGGSAGYDHKKLGITARGAWISVENHFSDIGIDITKTEFTVAGIGDMSGDVFGNGMLLSNKAKLLAAFNHQHIFLDPTPNPQTSLTERKRLFELPRSQWSDYNPALISAGGGIFNRSAKHIDLTPEVQKALAIDLPSLTPDELISEILKAPVDLLWNGGIGTYVKAESETHEMAGDKANDSLRINGSELRCKIVGEGGNLGMTQLGRIEYAHNGGKLNTDFIDNSAGVDCSDHEVNIKITLNNLVKSSKMSLEERNNLLESMSQEVSGLVLQDNDQQVLLLSLEEQLGNVRFQEHVWLIKHLSDSGLLNCKIEFLPTAEAASIMLANNKSLTRPEIAILIAYAKNSMFYILSEIDFLQETLRVYAHTHPDENLPLTGFISSLLDYFPSQMRDNMGQELIQHKLCNEIIATKIANSFINMLGCTLFHQLKTSGESPLRIIQSFFIVKNIFNIEELWRTIKQSDTANKLALLLEIQVIAATSIEWILHHHDVLSDIDAITNHYKPNIPSILEHLLDKPSAIDPVETQLYIARNSRKILNIINITQKCTQPLHTIIDSHHAIDNRMCFEWMKQKTADHTNCGYVDKMALKNLSNELEKIHIQLTLQHLNTYSKKESAECVVPNLEGLAQYYTFINELKSYSGNSWAAMLVVALNYAKNFLKDIKRDKDLIGVA